MNNLPENFDMVYDFINENLDELQKLNDVDRQIAIYWLKKYSDFQVNFVESE
jgi:hypothetical protein